MRSPLGALFGAVNKAPVPYVSSNAQGVRGFGGWGRRTGQTSQMAAMGASAALFAIVNRTSTATARETWHLHRKRPGGVCELDGCDATGVVLVEKHPALTVLNKPNEFYTRQELVESGQQHIDLTGEGWLVLYRIGNVPAEIWVLRPDRMVVVTNRKNFLTGYIYCDPDGLEIPIRKEDVLSMRMPNPMDPYRGLGPVQSVLANVEGSSMSAEWNLNFFRNGARPGAIVKLARTLEDREFDQMVARWNEGHAGIHNAGRTAFLEEADYIDVKQYTIADMQFVETANLNRDTILLAYTGSKFDVGILEDANRASATAMSASFAERLTVPRLDRWKGMLNNDFLPQFPGYQHDLEFVYSNPVPADRTADRADKTAAVANYVALVNQGVDPDEAAAVCGLPPMKTVRNEVAAA